MRDALATLCLPQGTAPATCAALRTALAKRGFEHFDTLPLPDTVCAHLPSLFRDGGRAMIAFNPLMAERAQRPGTLFDDLELEKAAHLISVSVDTGQTPVRITRSAEDGMRLARAILPAPQMQALDARLRQRVAELRTTETVLADLSRLSYRAKVELIARDDGSKVVKKTFLRTGRDAMAREIAFYDALAAHSAVPARLLERSDTALIYEFIDDSFRSRRRFGKRVLAPMPLAQMRQLADFVRLLCALGWDPIDLSPRDNILVERSTGRVRAIDFEFAYQHDGPTDPDRAYFLNGVPPGADVPQPANNAMDSDPYGLKWRPYIGLDKSSFLQDPPGKQAIKRSLLHPFWITGHLATEALRRRQSRRVRDPALAALTLPVFPPGDLPL
ncbi:hypothetical protein PGB28_14235 [Primorskyibacter aestuariivivens]|uniref:hypothetical protein n=1 Tax=Primorskyibacter aestuariivivens TaxID=1888912 RepID=UPI002301E5BE|nr:hypothetical protein [Primorskyibacter aestuariivivens]MDA7429625.1 hypothetical protein [Primorskyibacter aestuariivivens]